MGGKAVGKWEQSGWLCMQGLVLGPVCNATGSGPSADTIERRIVSGSPTKGAGAEFNSGLIISIGLGKETRLSDSVDEDKCTDLKYTEQGHAS